MFNKKYNIANICLKGNKNKIFRDPRILLRDPIWGRDPYFKKR